MPVQRVMVVVDKDCQEEAVYIRKGNQEICNNKLVDEKHPPGGNELSLYVGSDLDEPIDQLVDTTKSLKVNFTSNSDHFRPKENDEGHFSAVDQFHQ